MSKTTEQGMVTAVVNREEVKGTQEYIDKYFPIVRASTLSLDDKFLQHNPKTRRQIEFKKSLISAIKSGLSDFRAQRMNACFDEEGNICFKAGMNPAYGLSSNSWKKVAKDFMPEKESRLGTKKERIAFLALLIKYLIEERHYTVKKAWKAVCDQSKELGHYCDSKNVDSSCFEPTGSRQVGEWYDLGSIVKITVDDESSNFAFFGGFYGHKGSESPLAYFWIRGVVDTMFGQSYETGGYATGWVVLPVV